MWNGIVPHKIEQHRARVVTAIVQASSASTRRVAGTPWLATRYRVLAVRGTTGRRPVRRYCKGHGGRHSGARVISVSLSLTLLRWHHQSPEITILSAGNGQACSDVFLRLWVT